MVSHDVQRFYQISVYKKVCLRRSDPCTSYGSGNFVNAAVRAGSGRSKKHHGPLRRPSSQLMHIANCELTVNQARIVWIKYSIHSSIE